MKEISVNRCPCGSGDTLIGCCGRYHSGTCAPSAEQLMRSRYSAYVLGNVEYLVATTLPVQQSSLNITEIRDWSLQSTWLGLEIENSELIGGQPEHARVTFVARWHDLTGEHTHRERSAFVKHDGRWYFIDPNVRLAAARNDSCPCKSGQKFKNCCANYL